MIVLQSIFPAYLLKMSYQIIGQNSVHLQYYITLNSLFANQKQQSIYLPMKSIPCASVFLLFIIIAMAKEHPQAKLYFTDYCKYYNYPVQTHDIVTSDGYILRYFRIQKKNTNITVGLKPILLHHGLLDSSDTWLINDQYLAPGFLLANKGYDVWLGNSRGNKHSRRHVKYNPDKDKQFWDFTFQHMADIDLPTGLQFVFNETKQKVHYLGHSQGSMIMHIALSKRNAIVESCLDKYFAFGPVAYITYQTSPIMKLLDKSPVLQWYRLRHIHEFLPSFGWFATDVGVAFCAQFSWVCGDVMRYVMDADPNLDNYDRYDVLVGHDPSGTSVMNMAHWKQIYDNKKFQAYDYGSKAENRAHYGQDYPPMWDLNQIRKPLRFFVGNSDQLADLKDVQLMWSMVNTQFKAFFKVYNAGHCTFMWGKDQPWMSDVYGLLQ